MPLLGFSSLLEPSEGVNLSGTEGSPIARSHISVDPDDALVGWSVIVESGSNARIKGHIMSIAYDFADAGSTDFVSSNPDTDWIIPHDFLVTYYIRATLVAGTAPISGALDIWQSLIPDFSFPFGNRSWTWAAVVVGSRTGTIKLEIATDGAGANIVATGYYKATVTVDSGL